MSGFLWVLALVCIVVAFVGEVIGEKVLMTTGDWFLAAIALALIFGGFTGAKARH